MANGGKLRALIDAAIGMKRGNKEFALSFIDGKWTASIGNPSDFVLLGEVSGEYESDYGATPEDAVAHLIVLLAVGNDKPVDSAPGT